MKKRKIIYITGARAEYGAMSSVLREINCNPKLSLSLIVTGMHLYRKFGFTVNQIKKDGFKICGFVDMDLRSNDLAGMARSIGTAIKGISKILEKNIPDILLLQGDRGEMLAGAIVGAHMNTLVVHVSGGAVSGSIDDLIRHSITKLSHLHFPATKNCARRLIRMGEEAARIFVVGEPALDTIINQKLILPYTIAEKYGFDINRPVILCIQHPVTYEVIKSGQQMEETMQALLKLRYQAIIIYPNSDAGSNEMIKVIEKYRNKKKYTFLKVSKNIPFLDYLSIMNIASVIVGNSSSGIIEAPSFKLPTVNIGTRQQGRLHPRSVLSINYNKNEIINAINKALFDKEFIFKVKKCINPYGDGNCGKRITRILSSIKISPQFLVKKYT